MDDNFLGLVSNSTGPGQDSRGQTVKTFLASLVTGAILFIVQLGIFVHYRRKKEYKEIYQPRADIANPPELTLRLIGTLWSVQNEEVQRHCGMDGYFFLRYLKMLLQIFGGALPLLLSVLLPLNFMAGKGTDPVADTTDGRRWNVTGMDQLAWGNIRPENSNRYWAHFSMAVVTVAWVCFNFALECRHYITTQRRGMAPLVEPAPAMPSRCTERKTASPRSNDDSMAEAAGCTHSSTCREFLTDETHQQPRSSIKEKSTSTAVNPDLLYPSPDKCPCLAHQDTLDPISRSWWILYVREAAWHAAMMATLIVGAVLAVLSGILSQLSYFSPFRSWPSWLISVLQGIAPALCIALIMAGLPWMFRWLCNLQGLRRGSNVELLLQQYNFAFLFLQLFLVASLTCSLATFWNSATNISSWATLLAENVPKSSNYFISYMILQGLSISAKELAKVSQLASYRLGSWYDNWRYRGLGSRPASVDKGTDHTRARTSQDEQDPVRETRASASPVLANHRTTSQAESEQHSRGKESGKNLSHGEEASQNKRSTGEEDGEQVQWGSYYPLYTTIACIGFIYCIIAPLITVFNVLTFGLFLLVYRYNSLLVMRPDLDSKGRLFPRAIHQLFVGIYVMEICLAGMFFMITDARGEAACIGQAVGMLFLLGLTVSYQVFLTGMLNTLSGGDSFHTK